MVFIPSYIKLSVEENEETFSDVFVQINTFLEAYMLFFLERGSLTEMFSRKIVKHHLFPKQWIILCLLLTLLFFRSEGFSEEGCHVVTSKSNLEETVCNCNHLTHFTVLIDYGGSTKVIELFLLYSIVLWAQWTNSMLSFTFLFFDTAHRGGRNNSENYHLRGTEPFHCRDTFNINNLFLAHVSNVSE